MSSSANNVYFNNDSRIFYLSDDIDYASIGKICFDIIVLLQQDDNDEKEKRDFKRKPIKIYINSYGGVVYDMWALIDIIEKSKTPIYTCCTGYAMSAAFEIFLSGHRRFATRHATFMYHQMHCRFSGKYQDMVEDRLETDHMNKKIEEYTIERTNITHGWIDDVREKKKDLYIHAEEALRLGIIDEIL